MPYYIPAYDTEAIYPWWELGENPYTASPYQKAVSYEGEALRECLDGIRTVAEVHHKHNAPATFFLVAKLVESAPRELRTILNHPLFDLQCHTYTHCDLYETAKDEAALRRELVDSKKVIEDTFGRTVIGLTTPGAYCEGLHKQQELLETIWTAGYRYVRSVGKGPFQTVPAPLTQPFWYDADGYPDLLELALHAWHDNILGGQPFTAHWPPVLPWGYPSKMPATAQEIYEVYAPGIDHIAKNDLTTYIPCFHPWSIYRADKNARHIGLLLGHAKRAVSISSCTSLYEQLRAAKK